MWWFEDRRCWCDADLLAARLILRGDGGPEARPRAPRGDGRRPQRLAPRPAEPAEGHPGPAGPDVPWRPWHRPRRDRLLEGDLRRARDSSPFRTDSRRRSSPAGTRRRAMSGNTSGSSRLSSISSSPATRLIRRGFNAAGFSDGGQMTLRLACLSDWFAGFAVVSQTMKADTLAACHPARPVPMLFVMGTVLFEKPGGRPGGFGPRRVRPGSAPGPRSTGGSPPTAARTCR